MELAVGDVTDPQPFEEFERPRQEGKLERKKPGRGLLLRSAWVAEWFVVSSEYLVSFSSRTSCQVLSCISLSTVTKLAQDTTHNLLRIQYASHLGRAPCDTGLELVLRVAERSDIGQWMSAISEAQDRLRKDQVFVPLSLARSCATALVRRAASADAQAKRTAEQAAEAQELLAREHARQMFAARLAAGLLSHRRGILQQALMQLQLHDLGALARSQVAAMGQTMPVAAGRAPEHNAVVAAILASCYRRIAGKPFRAASEIERDADASRRCGARAQEAAARLALICNRLARRALLLGLAPLRKPAFLPVQNFAALGRLLATRRLSFAFGRWRQDRVAPVSHEVSSFSPSRRANAQVQTDPEPPQRCSVAVQTLPEVRSIGIQTDEELARTMPGSSPRRSSTPGSCRTFARQANLSGGRLMSGASGRSSSPQSQLWEIWEKAPIVDVGPYTASVCPDIRVDAVAVVADSHAIRPFPEFREDAAVVDAEPHAISPISEFHENAAVGDAALHDESPISEFREEAAVVDEETHAASPMSKLREEATIVDETPHAIIPTSECREEAALVDVEPHAASLIPELSIDRGRTSSSSSPVKGKVAMAAQVGDQPAECEPEEALADVCAARSEIARNRDDPPAVICSALTLQPAAEDAGLRQNSDRRHAELRAAAQISPRGATVGGLPSSRGIPREDASPRSVVWNDDYPFLLDERTLAFARADSWDNEESLHTHKKRLGGDTPTTTTFTGAPLVLSGRQRAGSPVLGSSSMTSSSDEGGERSSTGFDGEFLLPHSSSSESASPSRGGGGRYSSLRDAADTMIAPTASRPCPPSMVESDGAVSEIATVTSPAASISVSLSLPGTVRTAVGSFSLHRANFRGMEYASMPCRAADCKIGAGVVALDGMRGCDEVGDDHDCDAPALLAKPGRCFTDFVHTNDLDTKPESAKYDVGDDAPSTQADACDCAPSAGMTSIVAPSTPGGCAAGISSALPFQPTQSPRSPSSPDAPVTSGPSKTAAGADGWPTTDMGAASTVQSEFLDCSNSGPRPAASPSEVMSPASPPQEHSAAHPCGATVYHIGTPDSYHANRAVPAGEQPLARMQDQRNLESVLSSSASAASEVGDKLRRLEERMTEVASRAHSRAPSCGSSCANSFAMSGEIDANSRASSVDVSRSSEGRMGELLGIDAVSSDTRTTSADSPNNNYDEDSAKQPLACMQCKTRLRSPDRRVFKQRWWQELADAALGSGTESGANDCGPDVFEVCSGLGDRSKSERSIKNRHHRYTGNSYDFAEPADTDSSGDFACENGATLYEMGSINTQALGSGIRAAAFQYQARPGPPTGLELSAHRGGISRSRREVDDRVSPDALQERSASRYARSFQPVALSATASTPCLVPPLPAGLPAAPLRPPQASGVRDTAVACAPQMRNSHLCGDQPHSSTLSPRPSAAAPARRTAFANRLPPPPAPRQPSLPVPRCTAPRCTGGTSH